MKMGRLAPNRVNYMHKKRYRCINSSRRGLVGREANRSPLDYLDTRSPNVKNWTTVGIST